jgi:small conductance mechanosensitive channel
MNSMEEMVQGSFDPVIELASGWGLQVLGAIAVLIVGRWVAGVIRKNVRRGLERAGTDASLVPFVTSLIYYLVLTVVVIAVLSLFGIETTSLIAVLGAAGLAVGLALQGTLSNFAAGVMLLIFRPFRIGDFVDAAGIAGTVQEIGIFVTILHTPDNVRMIVPNSEIGSGIIKNFSANEQRRNDLVIGISYDDDIGVAVRTIEKVLQSEKRVRSEPASVVVVGELGDSSVNLLVRPWCDASDYWPLRWDLTRKIKEELEKAGCSIPYPQHDVHLPAGAADRAA